MRLAARTEGTITDPVYEGKSMAGLIDLVSRREIPPDATVLYARLGGHPPSTPCSPDQPLRARKRAVSASRLTSAASAATMGGRSARRFR
jgi:hypothetical protein